MLKNDFENQNFDIFDKVVNNFGKSDDDIFSQKILISNRCICGFMPPKCSENSKIISHTFDISLSNWSSFSSLLKSVMECNSLMGSDEGVIDVTTSSATWDKFLV